MGTGADINVPRPEDVIEVYRRLTASEYDTPLHRRARVDFNGLPNKSNEGVPTQYYFDAKLALPELEIWPTASATFASDYTLQVLYQRPFDDMDATADTLAFPQTWELAVVLGLASQLAVEYGLGLNDRRDIRQMADIEKRRVMDWDTEKAGIFLAPDYRNNGSGWGYY